MKNILAFFSFFILLSNFSFAQIGIGTNVVDGSAILEMESTDKGVLLPRMTEAEKLAIVSPATGLTIYQTDSVNGFYYFNGSGWNPLAGVQPAIEKTSNDGYRFVGSPRAVGNNAIDFSLVEGVPSGTYGARNNNAVAIGNGVLASNTNTVAIGYLNTSSGDRSVSFGSNNTSSALNSTSIGYDNNASGTGSLAAGTNNQAFQDNSVALGMDNIASGNANVSIGTNNTTSSIDAISIGENNQNIGFYSVVIGRDNNNETENTYMLGEGLFTFGGTPNQTVVGFYNSPTGPGTFSVGNGTSDTSRSTALSVSSTGTIIAPDLDISEITDNKALITKEYADATYAATTSNAVSFTTVSSFGPNFSPYNNGWQIPRFYIQDGRVYLEGLARRSNAVFVSGETILTLPTGFRPQSNRIFTAGQSGNQLRVDVYPDGRVVYINGTDGGNDYVSLDNVSFRID